MRYRLKINLLASWGDHAVGILIGLFLMPFVLNTIGDDHYGLWLFICSIAGYSGLANLGFGDTVSRFVARHHAQGETQQINQLVSVAGLVYVGMCLVLGGIAAAAAWLAPYVYDWGDVTATELRWVIGLLGANVIVNIMGSIFGGVLIGMQRIDLERGFRTMAGISRLVLTLVLLTERQSLPTLAAIFLISTLVENAGYIVAAFRLMPELRIGWRYRSLAKFKECFGFSVFALLDNFASRLIDMTDTVIIGVVLGSRYIIPYYVAHRLMTFIVQPLQHIGMVAMPRGAQLGAAERDDRLRELVRKGLGLALLLTAGFFIGACFFGDLVLEAWVGRSYPDAHNLLLILLGAQIIATPLRVMRSVLFGMGHVRVPSVLYFCEAVANLVLTLILIRPLGLSGVALGTAIPIVLVELAVVLPYSLRKLRFRMSVFLRDIVLPQVPPLLALTGYSLFVWKNIPLEAGWLPVLAVSAGGAAVLGAACLLTHRTLTRRLAPACP